MHIDYNYTTESNSTDLRTKDYINRFRDKEKFNLCCKACNNYGKTWLCPPFEFDIDEIFDRYERITIMATKIIPCDQNIPFSESGKLVLPERKRIQKQLLDMEKQYNGYSFAYTGSCLYCAQGTCTRLENQPCRYPNLIRPSLEACGFDIGLTLSELFDIELKWGKNGLLPEYLMMVSGFLHSSSSALQI